MALRALGFDVKKLEVQRLLREFDQDGDGLITEDAFRLAGKRSNPHIIDMLSFI